MSEAENEAGKGFVSSALLVAAVAAIMVAGMLLKSHGPVEPARQAQGTPSVGPSLPLGTTITPELASAVPADPVPPVATAPRSETQSPLAVDPVLLALATRAERDGVRLSKARGRWTAQLVVACKPETVDRLLDHAQGSTKMYVLPVQVHDDACFRVCFGDYPTAKAAAIAADLPKTLRGAEKIGAVEIAKVLP